MPKKTKATLPSRDKPNVIRALPTLRRAVAQARSEGDRVALLPTMGALHAGHLALARLAKRRAGRVVVSIFVNPTQFAPGEDFSAYPRTWERDIAALAQVGVDFVWAPSVAVMYPEGFAASVVPGGPALVGLEDAFRPHFFGGVATVVAKLLLQVAPDFALFGEKDYQQLKVVTAMARDLDIPVRIVGVPTVREHDGLAMSSRNAYLSAGERAVAPMLYRTLKECVAAVKDGVAIADALSVGRRQIERAGFVLDYLEARHAATLSPITSLNDGPVRLLVAARLGRTRLIDNIGV
jgi:pantoate--beta-alanine ligase